MLVTTKISIDLQRPVLQAVVNAVQGDQNTRCLEISIYSGGTAWPVPDGATVAIRYCKSDKTKGYYDSMPDGSSAWSAQGNVITMLLAPQMLTVAGPVKAQLEMILGSSLLATFTMQINVAENPAAGVLQSEDYVNWLQWMEDELEVRMNEMLEAGDFKGPPGPPAAITSQAIEFQTSDDYKEVPTGEWSLVIPHVAQGEYLWTRTTVTYNSGSNVESYSVARFGIDGSGSVSSVANISPDENGNVHLDAEDIKALSTGGGKMTGPINMNGQPLSGLNDPTANDQAANKGYVDGAVKKAAPRNLLDNSDFTNLVAQAGIMGNHGTTVYLADRWRITNSLISYDSTNRILSFSKHDVPLQLKQVVSSNLSGKTVTLAIKASSVTGGNVYLSEDGAESGHADVRITDGITVHTFVGGESTAVLLWSREDASLCIDWIALYEGQYTAETLPEYQPKGYGAELAECMRYYQIVVNGFGAANSAGSILYAVFPFAVPMAAVPSVASMNITSTRGNGITAAIDTTSKSVNYTLGSSVVTVEISGTFTNFENHTVTLFGTVHFCADL